MPHPGVFHGARRQFLETHLKPYGEARENGSVNEYFQYVCRCYFTRWPPEMPLEKEQDEYFLKTINDDVPPEEPDLSSLSPEELEARSKLLEMRKGVSWATFNFLFGSPRC